MAGVVVVVPVVPAPPLGSVEPVAPVAPVVPVAPVAEVLTGCGGAACGGGAWSGVCERVGGEDRKCQQRATNGADVTQPHGDLSLKPAGLADGLALKEQRVSRHLREIRPNILVPRSPGFGPGVRRVWRAI